jgi:hypothetical protein
MDFRFKIVEYPSVEQREVLGWGLTIVAMLILLLLGIGVGAGLGEAAFNYLSKLGL